MPWIKLPSASQLAWTKLPSASSTKSDYNLGFFQAQWFEQPLFGSSALIDIWTKI